MHSCLPDLSARLEAEEWMDDPSIRGPLLADALADLRHINCLLGGYTASASMLDPLFQRRDHIRILDVGCGGGDHLASLAHRASAFNCTTELVGLDANPTIVGLARAHLDRHLPRDLRSQVSVDVGNALSPPYPADAFDVTHAALFLHHFHGAAAVQLLQTMNRVARQGIVVNDLHRHLLAYVGIWGLSRVLRMSRMVQHDGPISVRRGFRRSELRALAEAAGLPSPSLRWHWAFRWTLSTLSDGQ